MNTHDTKSDAPATGTGIASRRRFVAGASAAAAAAATVLHAPFVHAQPAKLKVGLMLPATGAFAPLGTAITNGFRMAIEERGGKLAGREIEYFSVDDESNPAKAPENTNRLVQRDKVDVLIGTVHSGVALGMAKIARETGTLLLIPNAGADDVTGPMCAPNIFRTSFSNWQPAHGMGLELGKRGIKKAAWITWDYAAGTESAEGFKQGLEKHGGQLVQTLTLKFPETNFQPLLAQVPGLGVDIVGAFFSGGGAVQFVKEYAAAGIKVPLCGSGFLTEGVLGGQGAAADGIETALHYGDGIDNPKNKAFREAFKAKAQRDADVFAVQGYDAAQLLAVGLEAVKGNLEDEANLYKAMETAKIESPRGPIAMSASHNVVQDIYLRKVVGGENKVMSTIVAQLADPGTSCKL